MNSVMSYSKDGNVRKATFFGLDEQKCSNEAKTYTSICLKIKLCYHPVMWESAFSSTFFLLEQKSNFMLSSVTGQSKKIQWLSCTLNCNNKITLCIEIILRELQEIDNTQNSEISGTNQELKNTS